MIERVAIPFTVASASNVVCDHCTIVEPRSAAFELRAVPDGWASASDIQIQDNLIWWSVNGLKRFLIDEQPDGEFQLGSNLWWAAEMPAAIEWLGGFPTNAPPQVVDVEYLVTEKLKDARESGMATAEGGAAQADETVKQTLKRLQEYAQTAIAANGDSARLFVLVEDEKSVAQSQGHLADVKNCRC